MSKTASQTIVARIVTRRRVDTGAMIALAGAVLLMAFVIVNGVWPPRAIADSTHEAR